MKMIKILMAGVFILSVAAGVQAQELSVIKLSGPDMERGGSLMTALSERQSSKSADKWSDKAVSQKDLSDLLWAANGINRQDDEKKTAASAQNAQDVDIYVFMKEGVYVYDALAHALNPVAAGDHRTEIGMMPGGGGRGPATASGPGQAGGQPGGQAAGAPEGQGGPPAGGMGSGGGARPTIDYPIILLLVSENSRFGGGTAEKKFEWGCIDAGLVGQNVMLFCAANGLVTHPKAAIDDDGMKTLLGLTDTQHCHLELPVGYEK